MLPKSHRLSAAEVRTIIKTGHSARSANLLAKYLPAPSGKAAVVVSKKVAKSAVARNRIRRSIYSALQNPLPRATMVLMVQKRVEDFTDDINTLCSKLS